MRTFSVLAIAVLFVGLTTAIPKSEALKKPEGGGDIPADLSIPEPGKNFVCLYEHANYKGFVMCIPYLGNMNVKAERAKQYSAVRLEGGYQVTIYGGRDQKGASCTYTKDTPEFKDGCNDIAQSIKVEKQ